MKHISILILLLSLTHAPGRAAADESDLVPEALGELFGDVLRHLGPELDSALNEALDLMEGLEGLGDPRHYEMPEVLPNGDIIIRRRRDAPRAPSEARPGGPDNGVRI